MCLCVYTHVCLRYFVWYTSIFHISIKIEVVYQGDELIAALSESTTQLLWSPSHHNGFLPLHLPKQTARLVFELFRCWSLSIYLGPVVFWKLGGRGLGVGDGSGWMGSSEAKFNERTLKFCIQMAAYTNYGHAFWGFLGFWVFYFRKNVDNPTNVCFQQNFTSWLFVCF